MDWPQCFKESRYWYFYTNSEFNENNHIYLSKYPFSENMIAYIEKIFSLLEECYFSDMQIGFNNNAFTNLWKRVNAGIVVQWSPFFCGSLALHSRWLSLLKIEISLIFLTFALYVNGNEMFNLYYVYFISLLNFIKFKIGF